MITQWNDDEDEALQGLPLLAQVLYLRCLRRFMDYRTGLVGVKRKVSYQMFRETLYVEPVPGRNVKDREVTMQVLRTAISQLERAGLVATQSADRQLVFSLPLASRDESEQKGSNRGTTEEQQTSDNIAEPAPAVASSGADNRGTTDPNPARNNSPPDSGIREYERETDAHAKEGGSLDAEVRRGAALSVLMRDAGVTITAMNPDLCGWVREGLTDDEAREAIARAREYKPAPQQIPARYIAPIVRAVIGEREIRQAKAPAATNQKPGLSQQKRGDYERKQHGKPSASDTVGDLISILRATAEGEDGGAVPQDDGDLWPEVAGICAGEGTAGGALIRVG